MREIIYLLGVGGMTHLVIYLYFGTKDTLGLLNL